MEERISSLERQSMFDWDPHLKMGDEGKNLMEHSMLVWCEVCKINSIVSFECYLSTYLSTNSSLDKLQGTSEKSENSRCVHFYKCPIEYYASVLTNQDLYVVKKWHWKDVKEEMRSMKETTEMELSTQSSQESCQVLENDFIQRSNSSSSNSSSSSSSISSSVSSSKKETEETGSDLTDSSETESDDGSDGYSSSIVDSVVDSVVDSEDDSLERDLYACMDSE